MRDQLRVPVINISGLMHEYLADRGGDHSPNLSLHGHFHRPDDIIHHGSASLYSREARLNNTGFQFRYRDKIDHTGHGPGLVRS